MSLINGGFCAKIITEICLYLKGFYLKNRHAKKPQQTYYSCRTWLFC